MYPFITGGQLKGLPNGLEANILPIPEPPSVEDSWEDLIPTLHQYNFCLAMEITKAPYYGTEKILNALLAGCIPIFYGTKVALEIFNPRALIYYDVENPTDAIFNKYII